MCHRLCDGGVGEARHKVQDSTSVRVPRGFRGRSCLIPFSRPLVLPVIPVSSACRARIPERMQMTASSSVLLPIGVTS